MSASGLVAGAIGVALVIDAGGYNMTGSTATLIAAPGSDPNTLGTGLRLSPCAISPRGFHAIYTTTGADFTTPGEWQLQLEIVTPSGKTIPSPPGSFYVFPLLQT